MDNFSITVTYNPGNKVVAIFLLYFYVRKKERCSDWPCISLSFVFVFCFHKLRHFSSSSFSSFSSPLFPSDGRRAPGNILPLLLPHILTDLDRHILGSPASLPSPVLLSPYICISIKNLMPLQLDLLCFTANYPVWPALFRVTAVERKSCGSGHCSAMLRPDQSSSWIRTLYIHYNLYQIFCRCEGHLLCGSSWGFFHCFIFL